MLTTNRCIKIYEDINVYDKDKIFYACGNVPSLTKVNKYINSIEIPTRTCALLYRENNYNGQGKIFCNISYDRNKIYPTLGSLNENVGSMRIYEINDN